MFFSPSPFTLNTIPADVEIIFVADLYTEDYVGGAELTTAALISACRKKFHKLRSKDVTITMLNDHRDKLWIFANFSQMNTQLIPVISNSLKYIVLEYDYKYCIYRSPEKHAHETGTCDCHASEHGRAIAEFYRSSKKIYWMSEKQRDVYLKHFPSLESKSCVLSSVFSADTLKYLRDLRDTEKPGPRTKWIILGSNSWVKGFDAAQKYCIDNNLDYEIVWNLPYEELLRKLSWSKGFVYLPVGADTCPRMVIEAKLLECQLVLNENVQHKDEPWFNMSVPEIESHLKASPEFFWDDVERSVSKKLTISGYITTYNCSKQGYPYLHCLQSLLQFCDEVCIVDGGSTDGTLEQLDHWRNEDQRIKLKVIERDWTSPGFAVFDGLQKAEARKMCTSDFCWQSDVDEIVHEDDVPKIIEMMRTFPWNIDVISLPVIEYWGSASKVRADINPWKWRISRNKLNITHGIPGMARGFDENGKLFAKFGDGCDMIDAYTFEPLSHGNFYSEEVHKARLAGLAGNAQALQEYEKWFNQVVNTLPGVHHYSWFDIARKMRLYRDYWQVHWTTLANQEAKDDAASNMFFDAPWTEITDEMIEARAKQLAEETGGHIFHTKWKGQKTPAIHIRRSQPRVMLK